ncbi:MAG: bifunctional oligoribonuclease/PAP phosphatase NrnA [Rikenellaceae bacterium]|nr:bifunctional oligoribonuclease/PAP phosphatase NrnA [Rikenellaceae bacterium]
MTDFLDKIEQLKGYLAGGPKRIITVTHTNPDGDAIGSSLAWAEVLGKMGHTVTCLVPNRYPAFLDWMPGIDKMIVAKEQPELAAQVVAQAEVVFIMDLNKIDRLDSLTEALEANTNAPRILIDHHLMPPNEFALQFSFPHWCSTAYVTYNIISALAGTEAISVAIAENLYAGIMTDTGNFSFSYLTPDLMRAVAVLLERGLDIPKVNTAVYNSYTASRVKLLGYSLGRKMELIENGRAAYIDLSEREMRRYNFQLGDSEGFVNYPLTIVGVKISALFIETRKFIRVSLRSRGDVVDVNMFARRYFGGGGHKNAAGGKSFVSLAETVEHFKRAAAEYLAELGELD